jgi:hypothetical protein
MFIDQHKLAYDPAKDVSLGDFIKCIKMVRDSMQKQSFDACPLPSNPSIMTIPFDTRGHRDIGPWKDT